LVAVGISLWHTRLIGNVSTWAIAFAAVDRVVVEVSDDLLGLFADVLAIGHAARAFSC
jgi:hypothetical protein